MESPRIYEGDGDRLMEKEHADLEDRILLVPDALPSRAPDGQPRIRIMWGQHLLEDLLLGRYRTLVCAVNTEDNSHGIIAQLASLLPTSQWTASSITAYAQQFSAAATERVKVLKYDMDLVEVLAVLRPAPRKHLVLQDLEMAFKIIAEMIRRKPGRLPAASVSFLGARANRLLENGREPAFESVLRAMYDGGFSGDVYPSPAMWHTARVGLFARYPFPATLDRMRQGGY
jgi:hypothetical protein